MSFTKPAEGGECARTSYTPKQIAYGLNNLLVLAVRNDLRAFSVQNFSKAAPWRNIKQLSKEKTMR